MGELQRLKDGQREGDSNGWREHVWPRCIRRLAGIRRILRCARKGQEEEVEHDTLGTWDCSLGYYCDDWNTTHPGQATKIDSCLLTKRFQCLGVNSALLNWLILSLLLGPKIPYSCRRNCEHADMWP